MGAKITTCCYCGSRAVLVLDKRRHELVCGNCGAPLRDLKMMPQALEKSRKTKDVAPKPRKKTKSKNVVHMAHDAPIWQGRRKKKRRKPLGRKLFEEIWDVVEDIFD